MAFSVKAWLDKFGSGGAHEAPSADDADNTHMDATAMRDLETRLSGYTDSTVLAHTADTSAAHAASAISFSPTGTIVGTDVQTAVAEVASERVTADAALDTRVTSLESAQSGSGDYPTSLVPGFTLAKRFDPQTSTYNVTPQSFRRTRKQAAAALDGSGGLNTGIFGHSIPHGDGTTNAATKAWPVVFRSMVQAKLGDAGDGLVPLNSGGGYGPNDIGHYNGPLTGYTRVTDQFTVWGAVDGNGGTITPSIDGSPQSAINLSGSAAWLPVNYPLTQGSHAITFATTGFPTQGGLQIRRNGGVGAQVSAYGVSGARLDHLMDNQHPPTGPFGSLLTVAAFDLFIIELETNDFKDSTALATYLAELNLLASTIKGAGKDLLLITDPPPDASIQTGTAIPLPSYTAQLYACCDANDCGLLDLQDRWISNSAAQADGLMDNVHPGDVGARDVASAAFNGLGANLGIWG